MISQQDNEKTIIQQRDAKVKCELNRNEVNLLKLLLEKSRARRKNKSKVKVKFGTKRKLKIVNKNQNLQVVNMKLGCVNKKRKLRLPKKKVIPKTVFKTFPPIVQRVIRKIVRVPVVAKPERNFLKERICVNFLVRESLTPQRLWTAIGVTPTGNLVLDNRSPNSVTLLVHQSQGEVITQEVKPQTELSLTVVNLVLIELASRPLQHLKQTHLSNHSPDKCPEQHASSFGTLTLDLLIPLGSAGTPVSEKNQNIML
jgi:hypothetical protein